jgi:hypothetical protein
MDEQMHMFKGLILGKLLVWKDTTFQSPQSIISSHRHLKAGSSNTAHFQRQHYFSTDAMSLRDTESAATWLGGICGGAGCEAADEAASGEASDAAGGSGDTSPPGSNPPSNHGNNNNNNYRLSQRQKCIQELQYTKPINIKQPKRYDGKPAEDLDTWWIMVEIYIQDKRQKLQNDE